MLVHADLRERAAIATDTLPWTARGDVFEKVLEDDGRDHRTYLVRGAAIPLAGCVDALVLDGPLAGRYLHRPTQVLTGCTAFVKHRPSRDRTELAIDTHRLPFLAHHTPGLSAAELHEDAHGRVVLLRFAPGTSIDRHVHALGEEFFVLSGAVTDELGTYAAGAWVRQPPRSVHSIASPAGCLFLTFADHLLG
jgi:hypothetical protein